MTSPVIVPERSTFDRAVSHVATLVTLMVAGVVASIDGVLVPTSGVNGWFSTIVLFAGPSGVLLCILALISEEGTQKRFNRAVSAFICVLVAVIFVITGPFIGPELPAAHRYNGPQASTTSTTPTPTPTPSPTPDPTPTVDPTTTPPPTPTTRSSPTTTVARTPPTTTPPAPKQPQPPLVAPPPSKPPAPQPPQVHPPEPVQPPQQLQPPPSSYEHPPPLS
jgi:hypothetical protein